MRLLKHFISKIQLNKKVYTVQYMIHGTTNSRHSFKQPKLLQASSNPITKFPIQLKQ